MKIYLLNIKKLNKNKNVYENNADIFVFIKRPSTNRKLRELFKKKLSPEIKQNNENFFNKIQLSEIILYQ